MKGGRGVENDENGEGERGGKNRHDLEAMDGGNDKRACQMMSSRLCHCDQKYKEGLQIMRLNRTRKNDAASNC